jgi:hypothetical protein
LGFKRIGRVKGCGSLRSYPDEMIDAIIYGRDLGPEGDDYVAEERFDKIRYYLKHGKYPAGADRAEKSRLRSAATHYKLLPGDTPDEEEKLMLKDKEVIADPQRQYDIARSLHMSSHGGINKTTATVAEKYHWVRIKDTVSLVIKNCPDCKETNKVANARSDAITSSGSRKIANNGNSSSGQRDPNQEIERIVSFDQTTGAPSGQVGKRARRSPLRENQMQSEQSPQSSIPSRAPVAQMQPHVPMYHGLPLDPQIMHYSSQPLTGQMHHGTVPGNLIGTDTNMETADYDPHDVHIMDPDHSQQGLGSHDEPDDLEQQLINATFPGAG